MKSHLCFVVFCTALLGFQPAFGVEPGKQVELEFKTSDDVTVEYLLYLPDNFSKDTKLPFVFFLHGRGESNGPISLVAKWGPPRFAARGDKLPFILVSPQCPKEDHWENETQQKRLTELLDFATKEYGADEKRIYLTGLSMGGYGSWKMATEHPQRFAAVAPVCGKGEPEKAKQLVDLPIWVFHGDQDRAVPYKESVDMVEAIKAAGGSKVRFTTFEHIGHNSWSGAYATPELYSWMLSHKIE